MNRYMKQRQKKGLCRSDVANYLGVDYERYCLIEKGSVKMPTNLINKFNTLMTRGKLENKIDTMEREQIVDEWWNNVTSKNENGKYKLYDLCKEFNIPTLRNLGKLLGYVDGSLVSAYLAKPKHVSYDIKNKFYSFFENELNIQPKENMNNVFTGKAPRTNRQNANNSELYTWWDNFDLFGFIGENNMTAKQFEIECGLSCAMVSKIKKGEITQPTAKTITKIKNYVEHIEKERGEHNEISIEAPLVSAGIEVEPKVLDITHPSNDENLWIGDGYVTIKEILLPELITEEVKESSGDDKKVLSEIDDLRNECFAQLKKTRALKDACKKMLEEYEDREEIILMQISIYENAQNEIKRG